MLPRLTSVKKDENKTMNGHRCKICGSPLSLFVKSIFDDRHGYPGRFDIVRCSSCGFGQTVPEIPEDKISELYTRYYPRRTIQVNDLKNRPSVVKSPGIRWWMGINNTAHYHVKKGSRVLDIGCGDCTSLREIHSIGAEGYGIEPDHNVKQMAEALGLNVHIGLYNEINFPDKYFDYITMSQVLEHIHQPVQYLSTLRKILKDNGQVIIGVPNIDSRLRKKYRHRWLNWHVPYHINHFSRKSIGMLAERCGFCVRAIRTLTPNLWFELQIKLYKYPVCEGVKVPFLNGEEEPSSKNDKNIYSYGSLAFLINKFKGKANKFFNLLHIGRIVLLRVFDSLGMGESYLVFLEKNDRYL